MNYGYRHLLMGLMLLMTWSTAKLNAQNCEADFHFAYLDSETVILYPAPGAFTSLIWSINNETYLAEPGMAFWFSPGMDAALVCLTVVDGLGCSDTYCTEVYENSPEALCHWTDCVWPGDANGDRKANLYDLLNIGLGYGTTGPERSIFPLASDHLAWAPNFSENWGAAPNLPDFKHLDCDGNGLIDAADVEAIHHNYTPDLAFNLPDQPDAPPVFLALSIDTLFLEEWVNTASVEITAELWAGSASHDFTNLYGMALGIRYPEGINYGSVNYNDDAFLGSDSEVISLQRNLSAWDNSRLDLAFSRIDGQSVTGGGPIATVSFIISSDIIGGREEEEYDLLFALEGILLVDENGDTLSYQLPGGTGVVTVINGVIANGQEPQQSGTWTAFPNPATDRVILRAAEPVSSLLRLYNSQGQLVHTARIEAASQAEIPVQNLPGGIYTLESITNEGQLHQQKIVIR